MKKRLLVALAAILLSLGIGAVALPGSAFASWHGTCAGFHDGDMCTYNGFNGTGTQWQFAQVSQTVGACVNLTPATGQAMWASLEINWVDDGLFVYNASNCGGNVAAFFYDNSSDGRGGDYARWNLNLTGLGSDTDMSYRVAVCHAPPGC